MGSRTDKGRPAPSSTGGEANPPAVSLGHDGKIDGIYRPQDQRRAWADDSASARLELAARKPQPVLEEEPVPARPDPPGTPRTVAAIAAGVLLALLAAWGVQAWINSGSVSAKGHGLIVIDSVPSNARVFVDGKEVGRTPWVAPNTFKPGATVQVRVVYPGAQEWTGTLPGGVATTITAELQSSEVR